MMRVDLDQPLAPHAALRLAMDFGFMVPEHGADRMGRERFDGRWLYEMAQWQPRAAVYDDIRGWNTEQYLGGGEFYLEYGDLEFAVTVPRRYVVVGTGSLQNRTEVLTPEQYFLRPTLDREKFPQSRKIALSPELEEKIQAQEAAGHLVFHE